MVSGKHAQTGQRTPEQIREHYEIEKKLASQLRDATREERRSLYSSLYDELFRRVPSHPQLTDKAGPSQRLVAAKRDRPTRAPGLRHRRLR